jgi:hypothetical protein
MGRTWQKKLFSCFNFVLLNLKDWIMNVDRMEFMAWMERIMERFDIVMELVSTAKNKHTTIDGEELLDNQDILQMLKISTRSLQRYRSSGRLPYYTISGKIYYKLSDIHQFVRESFTASVPRTKANS